MSLRDIPTDQTTSTPARVRKGGLLKTAAGLVGIYLLWPLGLMGLLERLWNDHRTVSEWLSYPLLLVMTVPFVAFCIGLCELAGGRPFRLLESVWGGLNEWLQGLLSFLLLCLALGVLLLLLHLVTGREMF